MLSVVMGHTFEILNFTYEAVLIIDINKLSFVEIIS